jgi:hypothetical protein
MTQPKAPESQATIPSTVTDEELFCDYLGARLQQALESLDESREALIAQPQEYSRAMEVMRKVYELRDLKKQLEYQRSRLNTAREAAGLAPVAATDISFTQTPTEGFRAAQAEQADKIMAALKAQPRTCPSCQALLGVDATQCGCGYEISADATEAPDGANAPANPLSSSYDAR